MKKVVKLNETLLTPVSDEEKEFVLNSFLALRNMYDESDFIVKPVNTKYGGFGLSDIYGVIIKYFGLRVQDYGDKNNHRRDYNIRLLFLNYVMDNASQILGGELCNLGFMVFDKDYSKSLEYRENDGKECYTISKEKHLLKMLENNSHMSDAELGRTLREAHTKESKVYNDEFLKFMSKNGLERCKAIFSKWLGSSIEGLVSEEENDFDFL